MRGNASRRVPSLGGVPAQGGVGFVRRGLRKRGILTRSVSPMEPAGTAGNRTQSRSTRGDRGLHSGSYSSSAKRSSLFGPRSIEREDDDEDEGR